MSEPTPDEVIESMIEDLTKAGVKRTKHLRTIRHVRRQVALIVRPKGKARWRKFRQIVKSLESLGCSPELVTSFSSVLSKAMKADDKRIRSECEALVYQALDLFEEEVRGGGSGENQTTCANESETRPAAADGVG